MKKRVPFSIELTSGAVLGYFQRVCFGWEGWGVGGEAPRGAHSGGSGGPPPENF